MTEQEEQKQIVELLMLIRTMIREPDDIQARTQAEQIVAVIKFLDGAPRNEVG